MRGFWQQAALSSPKAFDPSHIPNVLSWWESGTNVTMAASPTIVDWNMEAVGTASWTQRTGYGSMIKVTGSPSGSGSQARRLSPTAAYYWGASQLVLTIGNTYSPHGYFRTDGTRTITLGTQSNGTAWWAGTTSASWIYLTGIIAVCGVVNFAVTSLVATTGWIECDDLVFANLSLNSWIPKAGSVNSSASQATAVNMPWKLNNLGYLYVRGDGAADQLTSAAAAASYTLHKSTGCIIGLSFTTDTGSTGNKYIVDDLGDSASNIGVGIYHDTTNKQIGFRIGNGSGTYVVDVLSGVNTALLNVPLAIVCTMTSSGYEIWINEISVASGALVGAVSASNATNALRIQARSGTAALWHSGYIGQLIAAHYSSNHALTLSTWLMSHPGGLA